MSSRHSRRKRPDVPTAVGMESGPAGSRGEAERFIAQAFRRAYDADIRHFMPYLMTLRSDSGRLLGALGLREAANSALFLEQYLDRAVEGVLATASGQAVERAQLVEVGNFAVGAPGGGRWLITALTAYLHSAGRSWAVFTCGPELRNAFGRLGIALCDLGVADPGKLDPDERASWGGYYAQSPRVMAASVAQSHAMLSAQFESECALRHLWRGALQAGCVAA